MIGSTFLRSAGMAIVVSLLASPANAETKPAGNINGWHIFTAERGCSITVSFEGNVSLSLLYQPRRDDATLAVFDPNFRSLQDGDEHRLDVKVFTPRRIVGEYESTEFSAVVLTDGYPGISARFVASDLLDDLAAGTGVVILRGEVIVVGLRLNGSAAAIDALRKCAWKVERANPTDPFDDGQPTQGAESGGARAAQPEGNPAAWVTPDDYPVEARRAGAAGRVRIRFDVGSDGRVRNCHILESSGHASLDSATCSLVLRRARFRPALDSSGKAVAATIEHAIRWSPGG